MSGNGAAKAHLIVKQDTGQVSGLRVRPKPLEKNNRIGWAIRSRFVALINESVYAMKIKDINVDLRIFLNGVSRS